MPVSRCWTTFFRLFGLLAIVGLHHAAHRKKCEAHGRAIWGGLRDDSDAKAY